MNVCKLHDYYYNRDRIEMITRRERRVVIIFECGVHNRQKDILFKAKKDAKSFVKRLTQGERTSNISLDHHEKKVQDLEEENDILRQQIKS
jgi:hypothetical protein